MGLFNFIKHKKKQYSVTTKLNGNTANGRQELLAELQQNPSELKPKLDIRNGSLSIVVLCGRNQIGTVDSKIVRDIESKYSTSNGLSCDLSIGSDYNIQKDSSGNLVCVVSLTVIEE